MIYLASPYTAPSWIDRLGRYHQACKAAAQLMEHGHVVFSPIAHSHGIAQFMVANDHDFWMSQDLPFLRQAEKMIVLKLPGWEDSRGVAAEMAFAEYLGIPIEFMEWDQ